MKDKNQYISPSIEVCDYWARNDIMFDLDPKQSTPEALGKGDLIEDEDAARVVVVDTEEEVEEQVWITRTNLWAD